VITQEEQAVATSKRQAHTRQLEARFGKLDSFTKSSDGSSYTMPLESTRKSTWPPALRSLRTARLQVPASYPIEPATLRLDTDSPEGRNVEEAFKHLPEVLSSPTLTQLMNHLIQHISEMAKEKTKIEKTTAVERAPPKQEPAAEILQQKALPDQDILDKPHVQFIPRPPEWSTTQDTHTGESEDNSSDETAESASDVEEEQDDAGQTASIPKESGVLLSFPHIELYGIVSMARGILHDICADNSTRFFQELMELVSLNLTVKCERCKDTMDIQRLRNYSGNAAEMRQETCKKCASGLAIGFRRDLIHANSARAGYLDLDGCTVVDMLTR
jgi:hypothetical protein